jgi:uncharacterized oxidoreductase
MNLNDKKVLITGGSIGIGLELAKQISNEGAKVMICARSLKPLEKARKENQSLEIAQCDVTNQDQAQALLDQIKGQFGGIDILINNAAVFRRFNILDDYPIEKQLEEIDINLKGPVLVTNVFLKELMKSKEPIIVNLTSPSAYMPMAASQIYSATKSAIQSWTKSLRHQLRKTNIKVVELNPPAVDTRMNSNNPDLAGMKLMSPERFAQLAVKGLIKGRNEILVSHASAMKLMTRIAPRVAFGIINKT